MRKTRQYEKTKNYLVRQGNQSPKVNMKYKLSVPKPNKQTKNKTKNEKIMKERKITKKLANAIMKI